MFVQVWLPFQMQSSASYKTVKGSSGVASLLGGPTSFCPFPSLEARDIAPRKFYWSLDARRVILAHSGNKNQHSRDAGFATTTFFLQFGTVNQISRYIVQLCSNTFQSYRFANRLHKAASFLTLNGDEVVEVPDSKWQGRLRHISLETLLPRKNGGGWQNGWNWGDWACKSWSFTLQVTYKTVSCTSNLQYWLVGRCQLQPKRVYTVYIVSGPFIHEILVLCGKRSIVWLHNVEKLAINRHSTNLTSTFTAYCSSIALPIPKNWCVLLQIQIDFFSGPCF